MKIKNKDITVNEAYEFSDTDKLLLKPRKNRMLLSDYQENVLRNNNIFYEKYSNYNDLLFDIMVMLDDNYDEELDLVSSQLAEIIYYRDTKK